MCFVKRDGNMKEGSVVMFIDEGRYAKWFYGQLGIVESYSENGFDGKAHCRVRWMNPVPYFDSHTQASDFSADKFQVIS